MNNMTYTFSVPKVIEQIIPIIIKNEDDYRLNEAKMLLSMFWLYIIDSYPDYVFEQATDELFKVINEIKVDESTLFYLDQKLSNSGNNEVKQAYSKYPVHDQIYYGTNKDSIISNYMTSLNKIKTEFNKNSSESICNFFVAKNILDMMVYDQSIHKLIAFTNKKDFVFRITNYLKIKKAHKNLLDIKPRWNYYYKVASKYLSEEEKNRYNLVLGDKLQGI